MDIVAKIRAAKELSEALGCLVRHFAADTGTLHLVEEDGRLHLKALSGQFPPPVLAITQNTPWAAAAVARPVRAQKQSRRPSLPLGGPHDQWPPPGHRAF